MQIIPVIDLKHGRAVGAKRGDRAHYLPLANAFCKDGSATALLAAYRRLYPFPRVYVAELDAIAGRRDNGPHALQHVLELATAVPDIELLLDAGFRTVDQLAAWRGRHGVHCVVGSETLRDAALLAALRDRRGTRILSLDFKHGDLLGPHEVVEQPRHWPDTVIVMSLDRVGTNSGPDFTLLESIIAVAAGRRIVAAGGVRDGTDLATLDALGVDAALLASALHNGRIDSGELRRWMGAY